MAAKSKAPATIIVAVLAAAAAAAAVIAYVETRDPIKVLESGARPSWAAKKVEAMALTNPDDYRAQSWLVRLDLEAGRADQASTRLDMMRIKAPDNYYTFHAFCLFDVKRKNFVQSAKECSHAIELSPDPSAEDINLAASSYLETGQLNLALPLLNELRKKTPDDPKVINNLGYYYMKRSQYEQALPLFQQAIKSDPDMATARRNLARVLLRMGRYQESAEAYKSVLARAPADVEAPTVLATIYSQQLIDAKNARLYYDLAVKNGLDQGQAAMLYPSILEVERAGKGPQGESAGKE